MTFSRLLLHTAWHSVLRLVVLECVLDRLDRVRDLAEVDLACLPMSLQRVALQTTQKRVPFANHVMWCYTEKSWFQMEGMPVYKSGLLNSVLSRLRKVRHKSRVHAQSRRTSINNKDNNNKCQHHPLLPYHIMPHHRPSSTTLHVHGCRHVGWRG